MEGHLQLLAETSLSSVTHKFGRACPLLKKLKYEEEPREEKPSSQGDNHHQYWTLAGVGLI